MNRTKVEDIFLIITMIIRLSTIRALTTTIEIYIQRKKGLILLLKAREYKIRMSELRVVVLFDYN